MRTTGLCRTPAGISGSAPAHAQAEKNPEHGREGGQGRGSARSPTESACRPSSAPAGSTRSRPPAGAAPRRSSLCGRSWRGRRLQALVGDQKARASPSGQVDPEDHRPVEVLGEKPAQHRPGEARGHEHAGEIDLIAAALPGRHEIGDDGLRERDEPAAAEALQAARQDQRTACWAPARRRSSRR